MALKKKTTVLTRTTTGQEFLNWRQEVVNALNAEAVPKEYYLIQKVSDQLLKKVPAPTQASYTKSNEATPPVQVHDVEAFTKNIQ
ncbi:hypothetical protein HDU67_005408, partial [Dinochytrium kinnereticum]